MTMGNSDDENGEICLTENMGNADVQAVIGSGNHSGSACVKTGITNAAWRGLHEHWANAWEIVDGLKTDGSGKALLWDNVGNHTYQDTGKVIADKGFAKGKAANYDLGDVFIPADDGSGGTYSASTGDGVWTGSNTVCYLGGGLGDGAWAGAFSFRVNFGASNSRSGVGFRLAKYDI